ncbi:MAG: hypothetical protein V4577_30400 [Bacteroidota bacterium]
MKTTFLSLILLLPVCCKLNAQAVQIGEVFDTRYDSHAKDMQVRGRVKKITETHPSYISKYSHPKNPVDFTLVWIFNTGGNYLETAEYSGRDGARVARSVYNYDNNAQMLSVIHYNSRSDGETARHICTRDAAQNSVRSEFYVTGVKQSFVNTMKFYNKEGKEIERQIKNGVKPVEIFKSTYDKKGNCVATDNDGYKAVYTYDENNLLTEVKGYDKTGKLSAHNYYKYNKQGDRIESKESTHDEPFDTTTMSYVYDYSNNWVSKTTANSNGSPVTLTRVIEYY